jgi:NAD(P)-dependent dehydrogenase (short-subunit alcohol dehydrogenase family)
LTTILRRKFANASAAEYAPFGQVGEAQFDRVFSSNVNGTLFSVQKAPPLIPDGGAIVLTASIVGSKGFPANTVYAATKAAVRSFGRTWATDLKEREIRVNVVSPSPTDIRTNYALAPVFSSEPVGNRRGETSVVPKSPLHQRA